jgi:hypothetical protein
MGCGRQIGTSFWLQLRGPSILHQLLTTFMIRRLSGPLQSTTSLPCHGLTVGKPGVCLSRHLLHVVVAVPSQWEQRRYTNGPCILSLLLSLVLSTKPDSHCKHISTPSKVSQSSLGISTYPSVYIHFETIGANNTCGNVGVGRSGATTMAFDPSELSTANSYFWDLSRYPVDYDSKFTPPYTAFNPATS